VFVVEFIMFYESGDWLRRLGVLHQSVDWLGSLCPLS